VLSAIVVPAAGAHVDGVGGIGIRLVNVQSASRADPRARTYIVARLAPGKSLRRRVEIGNSTQATANVAVYPAGATLRHGRFGFAPGHTQNELSRWTSVGRKVIRLAPGTSEFETVTIVVPPKASPGERYAVVWAEISEPAPTAGGVTRVNRVGVRMYVSIGPGGAPPPNFTIGTLAARRAANGEPVVATRIHNVGGRILDLNGALRLSKGPGGLRAGPFLVTVRAGLGLGESEPVTVQLDERLPSGPWRADLRLRSGLLERAAVATITFPRHANAARQRKQSPRAGRVIFGDKTLLVLLTLAVLAVLAVSLTRRPRVA
jgi:hypothetical protein